MTDEKLIELEALKVEALRYGGNNSGTLTQADFQSILEIAAKIRALAEPEKAPKICPHYYEETDRIHPVIVGRCNCKGII